MYTLVTHILHKMVEALFKLAAIQKEQAAQRSILNSLVNASSAVSSAVSEDHIALLEVQSGQAEQSVILAKILASVTPKPAVGIKFIVGDEESQ